MSKKFLAGFLSVAMVLAQAQRFTLNAYAADTIGTTSTSNNGSSKTTKVALGVGGALAVGIGSLIIWGARKSRANTVEETMRWVIDTKNNPPAQWLDWAVDSRIYEQCHEKNLHPESVFKHVSKDSANVAVCYYGKDALRNCIADATSNEPQESYAHSTQIIWYDMTAGKYMFGEPDCGFNAEGELKRFVEFGNRIYEAQYFASDGIIKVPSLKIIDLAKRNASKGENTTYYGNVWIDEFGKVMFGRNDTEWYHKSYDEEARLLTKRGIFFE